MKKITLLLLLLFTFLYSSFSFGQYLSEGFESGTSLPDNWVLTQTNTTETWEISSTAANNGTNSARVAYDLSTQDETLTSPSIDLTSATNPRIKFWWNMSYYWSIDPNNNYDFTVSIDDGTNITELFKEADVGVFTNYTWYEQTIDLSDYVGLNDVKILFNYSGADGAELNIDDILVEETPTCLSVTDLTATTNSPSEVEISWTAGSSETEWTYEFGPTGFTQGSGTITITGPNNPVTLDGLTPGAAYDIYVQANCGGTDGDSTWETITWTMPNTPPSNDDCDGAISLTVNSDYSCAVVSAGTTVGATASSQSDDVTGNPNTDVWFSFVATETSHKVTITDVVNQGGGTSTSTDMGMGVYDASGGCDGLVFVDDSDPNTLDLTGLTVSNTYLVRVYGWFDSVQQNNFNICVGSPIGTITPNFSDDFSTLDNWTEASGDYGTPIGTTGNFAQDDFINDVSHENGKSASVNIYGSSTDEYFISPVFDLSGGTYYLNYDIGLTIFAGTSSATLGADDYLAILVTQDGGSSWQELSRWDASTEISNEGQSATEIPLSDYGAEVQFAFYANSGSSDSGIDNDLFIDNFQITTTTLGTTTNTLEGFTLYPTIVKEELNFRSQNNVESITVFNLLGQKVFSGAPNANNSSVNLSNLRPGVYIVKVSAEGNIGSYKIIKE
ncbi:T9SS type A sorting domain-containing protein [bacterium]|nr:T9SS type A sorting domain-containing protein [bacterium]